MGMKDFNKNHFLHKLRLHEFPSQFFKVSVFFKLFKGFLKVSRFPEDLTCYGKLLQILGPNTLRLLELKNFSFHLGISKFNLHLLRPSLPFIFNLKLLFMKLAFKSLSVSQISTHKVLSLLTNF